MQQRPAELPVGGSFRAGCFRKAIMRRVAPSEWRMLCIREAERLGTTTSAASTSCWESSPTRRTRPHGPSSRTASRLRGRAA